MRELPFDLTLRPFDTGEGLARGLSAKRLRGADLVAPVRGVRLVQAEAKSLRQWCAALELHLSRSGVAFSHSTAAQLWGLPLPRRLEFPSPVHVMVWAGGYPPRVHGVVGHRARVAPVTSLLGGLVLVGAADAWCQLATQLSERELVQSGDRLIGRPAPLTTVAELDAAIARYGSRRGCRALKQARVLLRAGSESPKESSLRLDVISAGFPEPEPNGLISLRSGRATHGDLVFRKWQVLLEYDGAHHRENDDQWATDVDRLNELAVNGWIVLRVNAKSDSWKWRGQLAEALRVRGWDGRVG